ncbi:MAG: hypothetical protein Q7S19_03080 [bacterium]|nr:hypothetical protein [bacterium]
MEVNREVLKSSGRIKRKKALQVLFCVAFFLAVAFVVSNGVFHLDKLYIKKVYIDGNKQVEDSRIFAVAKDILSGRYYGVYPKSNILIYPKEQIAEVLLRNIPWLASVVVSGSANVISIEVMEREPKYLWCDDLAKSAVDRICYYLDKDGFVFDKAPNFTGHIYPEFYGGNKRGGYVGRSILPIETLREILSIKDSIDKTLQDKGGILGYVYGVYIYENGDYDLLLSGGRKDWKINFDLNTDPVKKFQVVVESKFFKKELDNSTNQLDYIDLRFGKKVFYKFNKAGE